MTFTGKILVILNMFMGILFMGFAMIVYQTRVDLRGQLNESAKKFQAKSAELTTAKTELEAKNQDLAKFQQDKDQQDKQYQGQIANLENSTNNLRKELADFRNRTARDEIVTNKATDNQNIRNEEIEQLRKFREELIAQKAELVKENTELKDKLQQATNDLKQTIARNETIVAQLGELERYVAAVRTTYKIPGPEEVLGNVTGDQVPPAPPSVEGIVMKVDQEGKFIQISLGEDDGIRPGQKLEAWRQLPKPTYLGTMKVVTTEATTAVVQPITRVGGVIQPNDRVGTEVMPNRGKGN